MNSLILAAHILYNFEDPQNLAFFDAHGEFLTHGQIGLQLFAAQFPIESQKGMIFFHQKRDRFLLQCSIEGASQVPFGTDISGYSAVGQHLIGIINVDPLHRKAVNGVTDHFVESFILTFSAQPNGPIDNQGGQSELEEHLMVDVFSQQIGILLALLQQYGLGPLGNEPRQQQRTDQDHHQAGKREIFDKLKWLE